jgi:lysophospholipase L1-like esterase
MKQSVIYISSGLIAISILLYSCNKDTIPTLSTSSIINITTTSATTGGNITFDGGEDLIARGVCWGVNINPSIIDSKTINGNNIGQFVSEIIGLNSGSTYHIRAYATNSVGTAYGADSVFTTLGLAPYAITQPANNISATAATLNGKVNANYLSTTVSFEYGTTSSYGEIVTALQNPVAGNSSTDVTAKITGLTAGTTYHFGLKTENSLGTTNGGDISFTTMMPVIDGNICVIGNSTISAHLGGNAVADYLEYTGNLTDISFAGSTIQEQMDSWDLLSDATKLALNFVFVQIGLNDLNEDETVAVVLGRYQLLIDAINADAPDSKVILGTMIPCKQRLINSFGPIDGLAAYQKWLYMNEAIKGRGANAINGMDETASIHTILLNDGNDNLAAAYDVGDGIHPNNAGRIIIARSWMTAYDLLQPKTSLKVARQ